MGELSINILHPEVNSLGTDTNEEGVVLQMCYGDFCGLFTGDVGEKVEKSLLNEVRNVDFLKVGHHGSKNSTCQAFLEVINPEYGVISCGIDNSYGHPAKETVKRLEDAGVQVEYTMKHGAICFYMDEQGFEIKRFTDF